jgi:hypothetical protein
MRLWRRPSWLPRCTPGVHCCRFVYMRVSNMFITQTNKNIYTNTQFTQKVTNGFPTPSQPAPSASCSSPPPSLSAPAKPSSNWSKGTATLAGAQSSSAGGSVAPYHLHMHDIQGECVRGSQSVVLSHIYRVEVWIRS